MQRRHRDTLIRFIPYPASGILSWISVKYYQITSLSNWPSIWKISSKICPELSEFSCLQTDRERDRQSERETPIRTRDCLNLYYYHHKHQHFRLLSNQPHLPEILPGYVGSPMCWYKIFYSPDTPSCHRTNSVKTLK